MGTFELALAIAGGFFAVIVLALLAVVLIFRKKIIASVKAARTMYVSVQAMRNMRAQRIPAVKNPMFREVDNQGATPV